MSSKPILLDLPLPILTDRLLLRPFMPGDGKALNVVINESFDELHKWMPWATMRPTIEDSEVVVRELYAAWILRKELNLLIFDRITNELVGGSGFRVTWEVPVAEIGYWIATKHTKKGFATEVACALKDYAFTYLNAQRIVITCDELNIASKRVAEKAGFIFEALRKHDARHVSDNSIRNTLVYVALKEAI